jgi:hypothetical protein
MFSFRCRQTINVHFAIVLEKEEKNKNNYTLNLMVWLSFTLLIFAQVSWYGLSLSRPIFSRNIDRILVAIV